MENIEQNKMPRLVEPSMEYKDQYIEAATEFQAEGTDTGFQVKVPEGDFQDVILKIKNYRMGANLMEGKVPQTELWMMDGNKFIGWVKIRHRLNEALLNRGGNIGYGIRPSERNKGYGTKILTLALEKAKSLGLTRVLVTCADDNIGSARIIENNGGILENKIKSEGMLLRRYWIEIK